MRGEKNFHISGNTWLDDGVEVYTLTVGLTLNP